MRLSSVVPFSAHAPDGQGLDCKEWRLSPPRKGVKGTSTGPLVDSYSYWEYTIVYNISRYAKTRCCIFSYALNLQSAL